MYKIMSTMPITEVRNSISSIVADLAESPVVLTQNGREAAVIVHPDTWNKLVETYEKWTKVQPPTTPRFLTWAEFEQQLQKAGISLDVVEETIREVVAKQNAMKNDPARVVSSKEMRKKMAERGVHVGS